MTQAIELSEFKRQLATHAGSMSGVSTSNETSGFLTLLSGQLDGTTTSREAVETKVSALLSSLQNGEIPIKGLVGGISDESGKRIRGSVSLIIDSIFAR